MRLFGATFLVLQLLAASFAAAQPSHDFGDDTYRTGVFTGEGTAEPGLKCDSTSTSRLRTCSGFLASAVDRTLLDVSLAVPPGAGPHPLVVVLHGWGGSKQSQGDIADPLLADGHAVLRYSARGFGESWGQVNLADVHVELEDLRSMIGQVVDEGHLHLNADAVGIVGVSYGGGQSWLALLRPTFTSPRGRAVRIRTIVPIVPWTDLLYSLLPNGRPEFSLEPPGSPKLSYINGLYLSGLRTSPSRPYPNYPDYLVAWHAWINNPLVEPNEADPIYQQIVDGLAGYRSIWWQDAFWGDAVGQRVPVFQLQGFTDDLFPLPEATRMLLTLKSVDPSYPIASYFGDIGHPRASNKPGELDYMIGLVREWFGYYLRGIGLEPQHGVRAAITRPRNQPFDPADVISVASYADLATGAVSKSFEGSATLVNPVDDPYGGFFWDPLVMEASRELQPLPPPPQPAVGSLAAFSVPASELTGGRAMIVAGQPLVSLRALTSGPRVQLNVRLIDVAPNGRQQLITRGTFMLQAAPGTTAEVAIPTYGNLWRVRRNHVLRLEITTLDSPYLAPSKVPSATIINDVRLEIPTR
jgi:ABC-2 type transport system ATP-binding protein